MSQVELGRADVSAVREMQERKVAGLLVPTLLDFIEEAAARDGVWVFSRRGAAVGYCVCEGGSGESGLRRTMVDFYVERADYGLAGDCFRAAMEGLRPRGFVVRTDDALFLGQAMDGGRHVSVGAPLLVRVRERPGALAGTSRELKKLTADLVGEAMKLYAAESPWNAGTDSVETVRGRMREGREWVMCERGELLAVAHVVDQGHHGFVGIGPVVRGDLRGRGVGTALVAALVSVLEGEGRRVVAVMDPTNLASRRAFEKAGFAVVAHHLLVGVEEKEVDAGGG